MPTDVAALLVDVVSSRAAPRRALHDALLTAATAVNGTVMALDPLRPTVGDEMQAVYPAVGAALLAGTLLRLELAPTWDVRLGIGGGDVVAVGDGIQDGSAWWRAREAIEWAEAQAGKPGYASTRTAVLDGRAQATPAIGAMTRLLDAHLSRLRPGAVATLRGLLAGRAGSEIAADLGITASANSQRIGNNDLRPLADAIAALPELP